MLPNMYFAREDCNSALMVRACDDGRVTIGAQHYQHSLILTPERVIPEWSPRQVSDLSELHFDSILSLQAEIILLGTGARLCFPSAQLRAYVLASGTGLEVMDTPAACRTYNILLSENRRVVAALLLP